MKFFGKISALVVAAFFATTAYAQNATVRNHAFAIGKGPGVAGYTSLLCGSGQLAIGSATDPVCANLSGDATLSATGVLTLSTVNANVGAFGSATSCVTVTANAKGLITAISAANCAPAIGSVTGLGTGIATALAVNIGSAGAPVLFNSAGGTPASITLTNATGTATGLTAGAVVANGVTRAMEAQGLARSVIGVAGNATANVADIQGTTANTFLGVNGAGTGLAFSTVPNAGLANSATTVAGQPCTLGSTCGLSSLTASLGADVAMNNTANFFDGPSVAQGTSGTWFASSTVTFTDPTNTNGRIACKLWDGTTVISSLQTVGPVAATTSTSMSLSGYLASPAGNLRISCKNVSATTGSMSANASGSGKDSTLTVFRIN